MYQAGKGIKMGNPYELGVRDANGKGYNNPFPEFSEKWALYNRGYNTTKYPGYFCKK
jgi:hypothetical protein